MAGSVRYYPFLVSICERFFYFLSFLSFFYNYYFFILIFFFFLFFLGIFLFLALRSAIYGVVF